MQDHVDPLVERIMRATAPDTTPRPEDAGAFAVMDRLLREHAAEVRRGARVRAVSSLKLTREVGYGDGYRAGVEAAVGYLRGVLRDEVAGKVNATLGVVRDLAALTAGRVRPDQPLSREVCDRLLDRIEVAGLVCEEALDAVESLQPVEPVDDYVGLSF